MNAKGFRAKLLKKLNENKNIIETKDGEWTVKGFADIYNKLYTISTDTKVVSKILEIQLFPILQEFAIENRLEIKLAKQQNHYPDCTFIFEDGTKYAVDLKSTYRTSKEKVKGFTLGSYTGYFRNRDSIKNILFPYKSYSKHFALGIIYSRYDKEVDERASYDLDIIGEVQSVIGEIEFLVQEKYKLASKSTGSGNTKNIGSIKNIDNLKTGKGICKTEKEFDKFWKKR
ncbi:MAG: type restriction endonuclease like [Clostridiales bacterium]|jgi:hypothetical protein|nr:type restriction endonuclease like [Clostridiales bacterium]